MPLPSYDPTAVDWRSVLARFGILMPPFVLVLGSLFMAVHRDQQTACSNRLLREHRSRLLHARGEIERVMAAAGSTTSPATATASLQDLLALVAADGSTVAVLDPQGQSLAAFAAAGNQALPDSLPGGADEIAVLTAEGLFSRTSITLPAAVAPIDRRGEQVTIHGVLAAWLPQARIDERCAGLHKSLVRLFATLVAGIVVIAWLVAQYAAQRDESSRRAFQAERLAAIGEAMAGLAHESRNAIQRGQASIEMLAKRVQHVPSAPKLLARLQQAQEDLHQLYERARSYAAPVPLNRQTADLREVVAAAWADLEHVWRARDAAFDSDCRAASTACEIDPFAMRRAFCNILENALSVENDDGVNRDRVRVDVEYTDARLAGAAAVAVAIRDNGPGLGDEQLQRIFEPFYTTRSRGTGLGMAITRRIVEMHGGTIEARRADRGGACLVITIPLVATHPAGHVSRRRFRPAWLDRILRTPATDRPPSEFPGRQFPGTTPADATRRPPQETP